MRENMDHDAVRALRDFTRCYLDLWRSKTGGLPASRELHGVPSPFMAGGEGDEVLWQPRPALPGQCLDGVERALALCLQPAAQAYFCSQYAGDMHAGLDGEERELVQVWSEADFMRVQENLIGHLLMQKRLRQTPTLFIATIGSELTIISLCNLTGNLLREQVGGKQRTVLATDLTDFLNRLTPRVSR